MLTLVLYWLGIVLKLISLIFFHQALAAEMTENFGKRLGPLGVAVRELTGDMQLTKTEIKSTQVCACATVADMTSTSVHI